MEKLFTGKEYTQKAQEANTQGQKLYIYTYSQEVEIEVPVYDENGFQTGTKKETAEKEFAKLLIAPSNYYICYKDNYTNGSVNPDYEEENELTQKIRISKLSLTKREVFLALYNAKGITPEEVRNQITDTKALIEFDYANEYYRGNPLIDTIGAVLGYSSDDLDYLFINKELPKNE